VVALLIDRVTVTNNITVSDNIAVTDNEWESQFFVIRNVNEKARTRS
jgi:hypothetical protein